MATPEHQEVIRRTRSWLERVVLGLELCPFARRPYERDAVRIQVSAATELVDLLVDLVLEAERLADADSDGVETTLLVHPGLLTDFLEFNDALGAAEAVLADRDLDGVIQLVGFHPDLRFADTDGDDHAHYANRSPYPTIHLLVAMRVHAAAASHPDVEGIPARNTERLRSISREQLDDWLQGRGD